MTNDASGSGRAASGTVRDRASASDDWERTALQRVAARHGELHEAHAADVGGVSGRDWERRAVECLRRYFRSQR